MILDFKACARAHEIKTTCIYTFGLPKQLGFMKG